MFLLLDIFSEGLNDVTVLSNVDIFLLCFVFFFNAHTVN